jgi:hypothetical protein
LKESENDMLLMPIGVSTVLEFSGEAAVLISPGRVSEVLCCESIPLVITLLSQSAGQAPAFPSKVLRNVFFVTNDNPEYSPNVKDWIRQITDIGDLSNAVRGEAEKLQQRKRFTLSDTKLCSVFVDPTYEIDTLPNVSHATRATDPVSATAIKGIFLVLVEK